MTEVEKDQLIADLWAFYEMMVGCDCQNEAKNALLELAIETYDYDDYAEFVVLMETLEVADAARKGLPRPEYLWADRLVNADEETQHD